MIELILFAIAMATTIFLLLYLLYMNSLINTLYGFGLKLSYEWAGQYYLMLRLGFALLGILVLASLSMVVLYRKKLKARVSQAEKETHLRTLIERIQQLRLELWKYKGKPSGVTGSILIFLAILALASSIIYSSSILALIGLGLTFWGVLFTFIRPTRYVKSSLLDLTSISAVSNASRIIAELGYRGKGIYLPPRYLKGLREGTVFIPPEEEHTMPTIEEVAEEKVFLKNPEGIYLTPSGLGLANLFEEELGINFARVDLEYLQDNLPKLFVEGLEIAEDFEMRTRGNMVQVKMTGTIYKDICSEIRKFPSVCTSFGCPLCSSIACALARSSGELVVIEEVKLSADSNVIEAYYRILGTTSSTDFQREEQTVRAKEVPHLPIKPTKEILNYLLTNLKGLVLVALGSFTLVWVGWLTLYDTAIWGKGLDSIFFGSRTGQSISLGIGMKVIHYFLMGVVLFLLGMFMLFRKRGKR